MLVGDLGPVGCCLATRSDSKKSTSSIHGNPQKRKMIEKCLGRPEWCVNSSESVIIDQETINRIWRIFEHFLVSKSRFWSFSPTSRWPKTHQKWPEKIFVQNLFNIDVFRAVSVPRSPVAPRHPWKQVAWTFFCQYLNQIFIWSSRPRDIWSTICAPL